MLTHLVLVLLHLHAVCLERLLDQGLQAQGVRGRGRGVSWPGMGRRKGFQWEGYLRQHAPEPSAGADLNVALFKIKKTCFKLAAKKQNSSTPPRERHRPTFLYALTAFSSVESNLKPEPPKPLPCACTLPCRRLASNASAMTWWVRVVEVRGCAHTHTHTHKPDRVNKHLQLLRYRLPAHCWSLHPPHHTN